MDIVKTVFEILIFAIKALILASIAIFILQTIMFIGKKPKFKGVKGIKRKFIRTVKYLRNKRYLRYFEFIKWIIIDLKRGRERFELFGIWCFTGYYGEGKTLGAINYAFNIKKQKPWMNIHIYSNFNLKGQDGMIKDWHDLLDLPENTIVIFDEIQSTFTSTRFKDFPLELLWKLTQCRKQGLAIFCSSPVYSRMTIQLRESTDYVIVCKNILKLKRLFTYSFYKAPEYEKYEEDKLKLRQHRESKFWFVAQDINYKRYNTHQIVDRLDIEGEEEGSKKVQKGITRSDVIKMVDERIKEWEKKHAG